ncbi:related to nasopharyngeal carcinoma susceptibility protein LZ16 [Cephalotrichum gorgonifer]|uniref:Related to nasopharyngeal carcinoma susceptibility protein LZ16 n=1 Tax=Cephalotrichum gorgonifer TaxID=2041049 RepID=A0AAE8MUX2_9PEZI|nr:related to nasopharyngeal carcinoma susceptibility protein LZ16 [Cephalotrichum gorgonifer]
MDAQNAAGPDTTKPTVAAASESKAKRPSHEPSDSHLPTSTLTPDENTPVTDTRLSPALDKDAKQSMVLSVESADERNATDGANSDAETIVLPGKDGHSPSKVRKVKHEDKSEDDDRSSPARTGPVTYGNKDGRARGHSGQRETEGSKERGSESLGRDKEKNGSRERSAVAGVTGSTDPALSQSVKKKRLDEKLSDKPSLPPPGQRTKDASVSTPTSPPPKRRKSADANPHNHSDSNSDVARLGSPKASKDKLKGADRIIPHKRKTPRLDSEDDEDNRKARRQRTAPASTNPDSHPSKQGREQQQLAGSKSHDHTRSVSPHGRAHRRSASTQLPSHSSSGLSHKKKRVPAPLQSTEYHSDESSDSGSPRPRSSKMRNLATPATTDSTVSPAKIAPHKKHLDAHGQTFLARACARGEYEQAKGRLAERPEDLNVADYAGNTPLQIAAINGCEDIVELLINAGCNLECVNYDKDTPLLDAVDNGHLGVVRLLLDAGVNPRKSNVHGEEPLDRVNDDLENADQIRTMLINARQRMGERRRTSEEHNHDGPDSPPNSATNPNAHSSSSRRGGTMRANKTSNHLLYMPMDDKTLRGAASRGDEETVTRILQVRDGCDDPEAMVNAARGGHDLVMQLLLALGGANPDPPPVAHMPAEVATPMLAAIGQENIKVIQLLLDQSNFDPTRRFKGETYYEIARRRQGTNWKDEEEFLKRAYEGHRKPRSKDIAKTRSPARRDREKDKEEREQKRANRAGEGKEDPARAPKRSTLSPSRSGEPVKKKVPSKSVTSPKEKKRSHDDSQTSPKRGPARLKNDEALPSINVSDRENSPAIHKQAKVKRAESELAAGVSSDGEAVKPRRKLVSKGELRGERDKQRRSSHVSSTSTSKDPASPHDGRNDDHPEKEKEKEKEKLKGEKYHDRAKALKRDQSRDGFSVSGDGTKRPRSSATPPHSNNGDKDDSEVPTKKRRLDSDGKERRSKPSSIAEDRPAKPVMSREQSLAKSMKAAKMSQKASREASREDEGRKEHKLKKSSDPHRRESGKSVSSDKSIHVKCEDTDVDMTDAPPGAQREEAESKAKQQEEQEKKRSAEQAEARAKEEQKRREAEEKEREKKKREGEEAKRAEEAKRKEEEEKKRRKDEEDKKRRAEEEKEKKRKQEEEEKERKRKEEVERKRKEEEEARKRKEEVERKRKEEEEKARREEEERKQREVAEKKRKEEEERLRKEEEERKKREAEEKKKREEEERLRREQLEREAAEAARRKREEEERREREHRERQRAAAAAREAEIQRQREEQERIRLAKLPALLRWLEMWPFPKSANVAEKFKHMQGVRYDTIRAEANGTADGREQWVLNTQVALLLGEKDLSLSRYTAWERIPVSVLAKKSIWRLEADRYALTTPSMFDIGCQLPNYYGEGVYPTAMTHEVTERLKAEAWDKFLNMDMFFVKLSDLLFIVPTIPHLRGLRLSVEYREIVESEAQLFGWKSLSKWKQDPDAGRFHGFAPGNKYYVNGALVSEEKTSWSRTSKTPFLEKRVPRRGGINRVYPDEPDYASICKQQGLGHLLKEAEGPATPNGVPRPNGLTPGAEGQGQSQAQGLNGTTSPRAASHEGAADQPLVNGINGGSRADV